MWEDREMIDFAKLENYKENNRIEAKKALGGLPHSIWETYSAFANTLGGMILLGVEEHADATLHPVELPAPEKLVAEFWDIIGDETRVSVNILSDRDVTVESVGGRYTVAIRVPRAQRCDKPVYINGDPFTGSYRRSGEGDYRCSAEEVRAMLRDASVRTQDMTVLETVSTDVLDRDTVGRYRARVRQCRSGHAWEGADDRTLLHAIGAVGEGCDGTMHPTAAGLLMFGREAEIAKEFPAYALDYREQGFADGDGCIRISSSSGDWSGNLFDFYIRVSERLTQELGVPIDPAADDRTELGAVHGALREALANCLIHADYRGTQGILIVRKPKLLLLSNPGAFRIDTEAAKSGGISDPRNDTLLKMFGPIDVGARTGSGIPNIFRVWKRQNWPAPVITEHFDPDRITLLLMMRNDSHSMRRGKSADGTAGAKTLAHKQAIIVYLTENISAACTDIAALLGLKAADAEVLLAQMTEDGLLMAEGDTDHRIYRLKS